MKKATVAKLKQVMAAGDPPLIGTTPVYDRRTVVIAGKDTEQAQINFLGDLTWINVTPGDVLPEGGWDAHDCL